MFLPFAAETGIWGYLVNSVLLEPLSDTESSWPGTEMPMLSKASPVQKGVTAYKQCTVNICLAFATSCTMPVNFWGEWQLGGQSHLRLVCSVQQWSSAPWDHPLAPFHLLPWEQPVLPLPCTRTGVYRWPYETVHVRVTWGRNSFIST